MAKERYKLLIATYNQVSNRAGTILETSDFTDDDVGCSLPAKKN